MDNVTGETPRFDATALVINDDDAMTVDILDGDGVPVGIKWEIRSLDSPVAVELIDRFTNKRLSRMQKRQGTTQPFTAQELRTEAIDTLVACTKGFSDFKWFDQDPLPFSIENARDVLTRSVIIREQVDAAVKDRAGFTKT